MGVTDVMPVSTSEVEVMAKPTRRRFTAEYKLRVLREAEGCSRPGEIGALLRHEGLYASSLTHWRKQRQRGKLTGLTQKRRGPMPRETHPLVENVKALERENARLRARAERAEGLVELQKSLGDPGDRTAAQRREGLRAVITEQRAAFGGKPTCWAWHEPPTIAHKPRDQGREQRSHGVVG